MLTMLGFIMVGFLAQLVDGSLGMSYGTLSMSLLLSLGVAPVSANSSVHLSKILTGGASGLSHWWLGNVEKRLFVQLALFGMAGSVAGVLLLKLLPHAALKPLVAFYLLLIGCNILRQTLLAHKPVRFPVAVPLIGAVGGFVDGVGGGGWGPVVTSTLLANGHPPQKSIGSGNLAEVFVSGAVIASFLFNFSALAVDYRIAGGLILGGVLAAPIAARLTGKLPVRSLRWAIGVLVILLSLNTLIGSLT